jgi:hypothetical protein
VSRKFRTLFASAVTGVLAITGLATPAQAATYPTTSYRVDYGNSFAAGTITWYNRSVGISGAVHITSGNCRAMDASTWASTGQLGVSTSQGFECDGQSVSINKAFADFTLSADKPGGAAFVRICVAGTTFDHAISLPMPELACQNITR